MNKQSDEKRDEYDLNIVHSNKTKHKKAKIIRKQTADDHIHQTPQTPQFNPMLSNSVSLNEFLTKFNKERVRKLTEKLSDIRRQSEDKNAKILEIERDHFCADYKYKKESNRSRQRCTNQQLELYRN